MVLPVLRVEIHLLLVDRRVLRMDGEVLQVKRQVQRELHEVRL